MSRTLRSGAKSGPASPTRPQRRTNVRRGRPATVTEQEDEGVATDHTPLETPLSQLSVQGETSKADPVQCGACLDYFHCNGQQENGAQHQDAGVGQSAKPIATIPAEQSTHQRLSTLCGVGFMFDTCHKGLCSGCFHSYLVTRLQDAKTGIPLIPMSCAECRSSPSKPDCINTDQIKAVLSDEEWNEYQRQLILGTFKKKFFCPNASCSAVFDAEDAQLENHWEQPDTTQVACPECKKTACVECGCVWHTGFTCDEFKDRPLFIRDKEDELVMEMAKERHWRKCPKKGCGHTIELSSGCNHITCVCGKDFCYLCSADWAVEKDAMGNITNQYCSRKSKGGPKCPLYTEESIMGNHGQGFRQRRHTMDWIRLDRSSVPYQKANTFTRHLLASRRCGYCNAQCKTTKNLVAHLETCNHDVFDCCAKFYKTREDFNAHVAHSHPSRQWVSGESALRVVRAV